MLTLDEVNDLCREIAEETMVERMNELADEIELEEFESFMASLGPRAFGPDEGANDSDGPWPWEVS